MIPNISPFQPGDKVVAYCRYSEGDDQGLKNTSVDEQEQAIREFCSVNSLQLVQVFADPFASGRSVAKRDKYLEMLSFLLHGKKKQDIAGVILWDYERYGRNYDRAQYDAAQLRMKGYKLFSMQQPITDTSPFAHVLESMYFASAQNQSDMISADVKRALQSNFTKYKVIPKSNIPIGWRAVPVRMGYYTDGRERIGHRAEPDPEYTDKIKEAAQAILDGANINQVREILGGRFTHSYTTAGDLFRKPLLYGSMTYGGTTIDDFCTPIIDKETFDRIQVYLDTMPKRRRSRSNGVYASNRSLLSGLIYCGECGERMFLDRRKAKGHTYETYYCNGYHIGVRRELIDDLILDKTIDLLSGETWETQSGTLLDALREDFQQGRDNYSTLEREIREIDRKLKRLCDTLMETDTPPAYLIAKMNELEEKRKHLSDELNSTDGDPIEKIRDLAESCRSQILTVLKSKWTSVNEKRDALGLVIESITVDRVKRHELRVILKHGLPGYGSVAGENARFERRPSSVRAYTGNLLTEKFIIPQYNIR